MCIYHTCLQIYLVWVCTLHNLFDNVHITVNVCWLPYVVVSNRPIKSIEITSIGCEVFVGEVAQNLVFVNLFFDITSWIMSNKM